MDTNTERSTVSRTTLRPGIDYASFSRFLELIQHQTDTGTRLPMAAGVIMELEDQGAIVDLETGAVSWPDGGAQ